MNKRFTSRVMAIWYVGFHHRALSLMVICHIYTNIGGSLRCGACLQALYPAPKCISQHSLPYFHISNQPRPSIAQKGHIHTANSQQSVKLPTLTALSRMCIALPVTHPPTATLKSQPLARYLAQPCARYYKKFRHWWLAAAHWHCLGLASVW